MKSSGTPKKELLSEFLTSEIIQIANIQYRENNYFFAKHMHPNLEIYRILEGCCCMDIGNQRILCEVNDFVLILPNIVHSFYLEPDAACAFEHIHFSPDILAKIDMEDILGCDLDLLTALTFCYQSFCHFPADAVMKDAIYSIIFEMERPTIFSPAHMNLQLIDLLLHVVSLSGKDFSSYTKKYSTQNMYVLFALHYIEKNYARKIKIEDISEQLHITCRYLSKLFLKHMNMTLLAYTNVFRMNEAIKLMADPNLTLTEISALVGMNDSQHFSKLFKSTIGSPPNDYRRTLSMDHLDL